MIGTHLKTKFSMLAFVVAITLFSTSGFAADTDIEIIPEGKAIVAVRHAQKVKDWKYNKRDKILPDGRTIEYFLKGLSSEGEDCSSQLAKLIPQLLKQKGYEPITKVVVEDPRPTDATPNAFDTIFPLIEYLDIMSVELNRSVDATMSQLDSKGSLVIAHERTYLWGDNHEVIENSILYQLNKKFGIENSTLSGGVPCRCVDLYVYTGDYTGKTPVNILTIYSLDGPEFLKVIDGKSPVHC